MPTIGLTGNFGMGKTTVLGLFEKHGAYVFNSDTFVHDILNKPQITKKLVHCLGENILHQMHGIFSIDRSIMAQIIFKDTMKRQAVERILHPEVLKKIRQSRAEILKKEQSAVIIYEVPLLFEADFRNHFDKTVTVYCRRETATKRLLRKGFTLKEIRQRLRAQMPITRKKMLSDFVIDNSNGLDRTEKDVMVVLERCKARKSVSKYRPN